MHLPTSPASFEAHSRWKECHGAIDTDAASVTDPTDEASSADLASKQSSVDRGSSVAEFALVIVVLMLLFLSLVQICLWAYSRTLLTSAAVETAHSAGLAGSHVSNVTGAVGASLGGGITGATRDTLRCNISNDGLMARVECTMQAPGIVGVLDGLMPEISVTGHSALEIPG
ncbi:TadE family protein [Nakamurella antarctica]|uniref:TadE family protein n=1 Tax=Nakamurella antarctica TaxID=1902245 RepID=UPI0013DE0565|nr:TadE family protein [Nakamurella antarctica]